MSRPKGSKNKKTLAKLAKLAKLKKGKMVKKAKRGRPRIKNVKIVKKSKRGRPKGSKAKATKNLPTESLKPTYKSYKFLGNCPKCKGMITSSDLVSKRICVCKSCGKRSDINKIRSVKRLANLYSSRKEYLDATMEVHHENVPLNDKIDVKVIQVIDD